MDYTPRQMVAFDQIAADRKRQDMRDLLVLHTRAAQSVSKDGAKAINEQLKKWES
jgi:hypothetical protein